MGLTKTTLLITGGALTCGALLIGFGPMSSYLRTTARVASENVQSAVPTTFEIERIQTLVEDLDSVITDQQAKLVKQRIDLEYLQQEVERSENRVDHLENEVSEARRILGVERASYTIGSRQYQRSMVVNEARSKAESLIRAKEIYAAKAQTMAALDQALNQAEHQLSQARQQRQTYAMRLAELRAKAENVAIRQELATSLDDLPVAIDGGAFQDVEEAFRRVEKELEVQDRLLEEQFDTGPAIEDISFAAPGGDSNVLADLDRALGRSTAVETDIASTPALTEGNNEPIAFASDAIVH